MVAVFAYHDHAIERRGGVKVETIGIAYSLDRGRTWSKYRGNPVLPNPGIRNFRDPKVFWMASAHKWIMTLAVKDHVSFYSSGDLKAWRYESDFGQDIGEHHGVWECPDLVPMKVAGEDREYFTLIVSVNPGAPNGGSGIQYFVGQFDGHRFRLEDRLDPQDGPGAVPRQPRWLDFGTDDYAGVTWSGLGPSDGRILFLGWMSNWDYAAKVPTKVWRGAMTLPRELRLVHSDHGLEVRSLPVTELDSLRGRDFPIAPVKVGRPVELLKNSKTSSQFEIELAIRPADSDIITLVLSNSLQEKVEFRVNRPAKHYELDRTDSGISDFSHGFGSLQTAPLEGNADPLKLHIYVDQSSVEIFINDGERVFTDLVFPHEGYNSILLSADKEIQVISGAMPVVSQR
jgi:fructan beta-fructosidase